MITNYATLVAFVVNHLQLDPETEAEVPTFIGLAEASLRRMLTTPEREEQTTLTTVADQSYVTLPDDVRQIRAAYFDSDYPLSPVSLNTLLGYSAASGSPQVYCVANQSLFLSPTPDAAYSVVLTYLAKIPPLSATNTTNWLIENHPDAYLYAVLMQAEAFRANDERIPLLASALDGVVDQINKEGNRYRNSAPMRLRSPVVV